MLVCYKETTSRTGISWHYHIIAFKKTTIPYSIPGLLMGYIKRENKNGIGTVKIHGLLILYSGI
jgi:hypothetical protein